MMLKFKVISFLLRNRMMVLGVAWLLSLGGAYLYGAYKEAEECKNAALAAELEQANQNIEALNNKVKKEIKIIEKENTLIEEINDAPINDDGIVAPVLRRTIDGL